MGTALSVDAGQTVSKKQPTLVWITSPSKRLLSNPLFHFSISKPAKNPFTSSVAMEKYFTELKPCFNVWKMEPIYIGPFSVTGTFPVSARFVNGATVLWPITVLSSQ
jgi:hypothetical protein